MRYNTELTIEERFRSGGLLKLSEFCLWAAICRVSAYKEISEGRLKATKIGRTTRIAGEDATAWRDARRSIAA